jgi:hypothetical protein
MGSHVRVTDPAAAERLTRRQSTDAASAGTAGLRVWVTVCNALKGR